ncbi:hypothetical protein RCL1_005380 [Eukaryota sp. TZLM3-RCL]
MRKLYWEGRDVEQILVDYFVKKLSISTARDEITILKSIQANMVLLDNPSSSELHLGTVEVNSEEVHLRLSFATLNGMLKVFWQHFSDFLTSFCTSPVDFVVVTGGSSHLYFIDQIIEKQLRKPVHRILNPISDISRGTFLYMLDEYRPMITKSPSTVNGSPTNTTVTKHSNVNSNDNVSTAKTIAVSNSVDDDNVVKQQQDQSHVKTHVPRIPANGCLAYPSAVNSEFSALLDSASQLPSSPQSSIDTSPTSNHQVSQTQPKVEITDGPLPCDVQKLESKISDQNLQIEKLTEQMKEKDDTIESLKALLRVCKCHDATLEPPPSEQSIVNTASVTHRGYGFSVDIEPVTPNRFKDQASRELSLSSNRSQLSGPIQVQTDSVSTSDQDSKRDTDIFVDVNELKKLFESVSRDFRTLPVMQYLETHLSHFNREFNSILQFFKPLLDKAVACHRRDDFSSLVRSYHQNNFTSFISMFDDVFQVNNDSYLTIECVCMYLKLTHTFPCSIGEINKRLTFSFACFVMNEIVIDICSQIYTLTPQSKNLLNTIKSIADELSKNKKPSRTSDTLNRVHGLLTAFSTNGNGVFDYVLEKLQFNLSKKFTLNLNIDLPHQYKTVFIISDGCHEDRTDIYHTNMSLSLDRQWGHKLPQCTWSIQISSWTTQSKIFEFDGNFCSWDDNICCSEYTLSQSSKVTVRISLPYSPRLLSLLYSLAELVKTS